MSNLADKVSDYLSLCKIIVLKTTQGFLSEIIALTISEVFSWGWKTNCFLISGKERINSHSGVTIFQSNTNLLRHSFCGKPSAIALTLGNWATRKKWKDMSLAASEIVTLEYNICHCGLLLQKKNILVWTFMDSEASYRLITPQIRATPFSRSTSVNNIQELKKVLALNVREKHSFSKYCQVCRVK